MESFEREYNMNLLKYFGLQFILFSVLILTNFYLDGYISKPFTRTDLIAIVIGVAILILCLSLYTQLKKRLKPIRVFNKIFFTILAVFNRGFNGSL